MHRGLVMSAYLGGLVLAGSDEVGPVRRPLEIDNGLVELVDGHVVQQVASLAVILGDATVLVTGNDVLVESTPACDGGLALVADDGEDLLVALLGLDVGVDVHDDNVAQVAHALLGDTQQLGAVFVELDTLDGRGELPDLEAAARLDVPQADRVVGGARGDHGRRGVDIDGPDGTDVAVVGSDALAVVRPPGADVLILCDGEDDIAVEVVSIPQKGRDMLASGISNLGPLPVRNGTRGEGFEGRIPDLGERTLVPSEENGSHDGRVSVG